MASNKNWVSKKLQAAVAGAGNAVGGAVSAVGNGVSGAGRGVAGGIEGSTRGAADAIRNYGNSIKDASGASGPRAATSSNPLGIAGSSTSRLSSSYSGRGSAGKASAADPLGLNR